MPTWNRYDETVFRECALLRAYGVTGREREPHHVPRAGDSYKAQALRELAYHCILQETIREQQSQLAKAIDREEAALCAYDILRRCALEPLLECWRAVVDAVTEQPEWSERITLAMTQAQQALRSTTTLIEESISGAPA